MSAQTQWAESGGVTGATALEVTALTVELATAQGWQRVVSDVDLSVPSGRTRGLVGESGSGKTVAALAVMGLLPARSSRVTGTISSGGADLTTVGPDVMRELRGRDIAMVFQEPMTSLNPAFTVGNQIAETVRAHGPESRAVARRRAVEVLGLVGIPDPVRRADDYPHQLSGGMRQRAMIAMALVNSPRLLIADEPTTALDVTIQAQVLELLHRLQDELGTAMLFITHDMGVVADIAHEVTVLYAGQVVEAGPVDTVFHGPRHPYTEGLLDAMPQLAPPGEPLHGIAGQVPRPDQMPAGCRFAPRCSYVVDRCLSPVPLINLGPSVARCVRTDELALRGTRPVPMSGHVRPLPESAPLLEVHELTKEFPVLSGVLRRRIGTVSAVDGVSFAVPAGTTLGLVGESGSGKTTTARMILRLDEPTSGTVSLGGSAITSLPESALRSERRRMQVVFQDPYSSLDPRSTIAESVGEPLEVHEHLDRHDRDRRVAELLERVGLGSHLMRRYPHEFSGGQRQRIALARALALSPELIICDEPVSALDVSTQSQVVNLLTDLQRDLGLTYVFIAHDLSVVRHISHRIAVMYLGRLVEIGPTEEVYSRPRHPYTQALLSAIPVPDPRRAHERHRIVLTGDVPSPLSPPAGCRFHTRCGFAMEVCRTVQPAMTPITGGGSVACHLHSTGPTLDGRPLVELGPPTTAGAGSSGSDTQRRQ